MADSVMDSYGKKPKLYGSIYDVIDDAKEGLKRGTAGIADLLARGLASSSPASMFHGRPELVKALEERGTLKKTPELNIAGDVAEFLGPPVAKAAKLAKALGGAGAAMGLGSMKQMSHLEAMKDLMKAQLDGGAHPEDAYKKVYGLYANLNPTGKDPELLQKFNHFAGFEMKDGLPEILDKFPKKAKELEEGMAGMSDEGPIPNTAFGDAKKYRAEAWDKTFKNMDFSENLDLSPKDLYGIMMENDTMNPAEAVQMVKHFYNGPNPKKWDMDLPTQDQWAPMKKQYEADMTQFGEDSFQPLAQHSWKLPVSDAPGYSHMNLETGEVWSKDPPPLDAWGDPLPTLDASAVPMGTTPKISNAAPALLPEQLEAMDRLGLNEDMIRRTTRATKEGPQDVLKRFEEAHTSGMENLGLPAGHTPRDRALAMGFGDITNPAEIHRRGSNTWRPELTPQSEISKTAKKGDNTGWRIPAVFGSYPHSSGYRGFGDKTTQLVSRVPDADLFDPANPEHRVLLRETLDDLRKSPPAQDSIPSHYKEAHNWENFDQMSDFKPKMLVEAYENSSEPRARWTNTENPNLVYALKERMGMKGFRTHEGGENWAVFEPNQLRSTDAAFDPKRKFSRNIFASGAGAGGAGLLAAILANQPPEEQ